MPAALRLGHIYQANPSWPWYNYYTYTIQCLIYCNIPTLGAISDAMVALTEAIMVAPTGGTIIYSICKKAENLTAEKHLQ